MKNKLTYISLFSSAGVGCFGFKQAGFECIATNELIKRRLDVQRFNKKCKYDSGYICGDITREETKQILFNEIAFWKSKENIREVDVLIVTPPCQGMSVANHKKTNNEIVRNSLVVESIKIIKEIRPRFFIFENVPSFLKTICTDIDKKDKPISAAIKDNLDNDYNYIGEVINFKNYGSNSSRNRTLVIGVRKDVNCIASNLFPNYTNDKTLKETIGNLMSLTEPYQFDPNDAYHFFRGYSERMRRWIASTPEGRSAFDNKNIEDRPHQIKDGKIVENVKKNSDKYTRLRWDSVGPCIHTRNDQLASQNTVHPKDDRVLSIRELMVLMTIPEDFKWSELSLSELNAMLYEDKRAYIRKEEIKIRQSIGEAVPTIIFKQIAKKIKEWNQNSI